MCLQGVARDWHLAKRYLDQAAETDREAWAPVTLALARLALRQLWAAWQEGGGGPGSALPQWTLLNRLLGRGPGASGGAPSASARGKNAGGFRRALERALRSWGRSLADGGRARRALVGALGAMLPLAVVLVAGLARFLWVRA